ncbi:PE-PPE domain-containing protein [Mycolicibacterium cosmeticum]|uniref:PPE family protein n=1 Tax=Mycolicibacterium cosmeticum TaxID=258533 RepID=W9AYD7_MYCCO|nr:PE-PPE domain-containing protein [Mycolicibacterium cosmeticum]TLH73946.1 PE-PPE domain-containing protein [Mycolicibacterium cosmeticum]CDO10854.1 PPE family protein [Mycolicibacterium cosmeticum]
MHIARRSVLTVFALLTAVFLTIASVLGMAVALAATALIVPGTGTPKAGDVTDYMTNALKYYIAPSDTWSPSGCTTTANCNLKPIDYPAQFWPIPLPGWGGLDGAKWDVSTGAGLSNLNSTLVNTLAQNPANAPIVIFGYSQGGNIVSREKRNLGYLPKDQHYLSFVMIGNTNRPNGGLFERLAFLGHVPILDATFGLPAPTDTCDHICATDIAFEYDGVSDFPLYPLNALAALNAIAGFWYVHGTYLSPDGKSTPDELPDDYTPAELAAQIADPANQTDYGDTRYITIPTRTLPLVRPFLEFGGFTHTSFIIKPIVDLLEPVLRVLIDTGYDRSLSPGVPAPFRLIPLNINPVKLAGDVIKALGEGVQAALADIGVKVPKAPQPVTTTPTTSLAAAKDSTVNLTAAKTADTAKTEDTAIDTTKADTTKVDNPKTVADNTSAEAEPTDTKTTEPAATPEPVRPKVRGPIGAGPLAQLVRQFGQALTGKHGVKAADTTKPGTEPATKPESTPDGTEPDKTEKPAATAESDASQPAKDDGATTKAAA